jgi:hypothetical protein
MKPLLTSLTFLMMGLYGYGQQPADTVVTIKAKGKMQFELPKNEKWVQTDDPCIRFEYPTPHTLVVVSTCTEDRLVTIKRLSIIDKNEDPLLDVPKPKGQ